MAPKSPKSNEEAARDLVRLIKHYGISDDNPERLHSKVLYHVLRDGRVRLPPKREPRPKRGRPPQWTAEKGLELVNDVEHIRARKLRSEAARTGEPLRSLKRMGVAAAIRELQTRYPEKWGGYRADDLRKRYYEAKRVWNYARRLHAPFVEKP
jgi:hypothetical protein